jgi:transcriptional regulator with XRE-family HTH domain
MDNRIKELRDARGWSMRELAARANTSASTINKLEKGETVLNVVWMQRLAKIFDIPPENLLGSRDETAPKNDAEPFKEGQEASINIPLSPTQFLYQVKSSVLDQIGIIQGDILVMDSSPSDLSALETEDVVLAQLHRGDGRVMMLRQFIAPSLLITNSSSDNQRIINLRTDNVVLKAVVVSSHSQLRRRRG